MSYGESRRDWRSDFSPTGDRTECNNPLQRKRPPRNVQTTTRSRNDHDAVRRYSPCIKQYHYSLAHHVHESGKRRRKLRSRTAIWRCCVGQKVCTSAQHGLTQRLRRDADTCCRRWNPQRAPDAVAETLAARAITANLFGKGCWPWAVGCLDGRHWRCNW